MKNYLSLNERNTWLLSMTLAIYNEDIIDTWGKNLTKEESKKLKTSITMTKNALKSMSDRMPPNERKRILKHSRDFEVRVLNQTSARVIENRADKDNETVEIDRLEFEKVINEFMKVKCANCTTNCNECSIYDFLIDTSVPRYELIENCPYAFRHKTYDDVKKKTRKEKKTKNRFDDEGNDYEYNFKPSNKKKVV
ncbi:DUF5651 domain-containing protein [Romboutsia sp. 1001285H_161024_C4]|uniref:DUF5651 domain-containing protein n=1 Tax=Romboutsia sp. 1001285H_161024_C4 TaxID=2787109 RepID=UPI00189AE1E0|nr:DUF5651 domain-containing protein [Romboutsia sp. 1001285H_161024_C4]